MKLRQSIYGEAHPITKRTLDLFTVIYAEMGKEQYSGKMICVVAICFSLRASSSGRSGGGAGKGRSRLQLRLRNLNSTSNSLVAPRRLSCQISANQREAEKIANVNKQFKSRAKVMTSLLMSSPPIRISHFRIDFFDAGIQIPET